jgi:type I restriction enzyme S subunit
LRFPGFTGEWKKKSLGQITEITKGNGISKEQLSDHGTPCILYGELYTKYKSEIINEIHSKTALNSSSLVKSQANDVIIPCSGETAIDISTARCVPYNNILLGGDLNIIRLQSQDGGFFAYQLNGVRKHDIARIAQGVSVVHLYGENLKKIKVFYPSIEEQRKITSLLSLIDERIATQNKIIEDLKKLKSAFLKKLLQGKEWNKYYIRNLAEVKGGGTPSSSNTSFWSGNIPWVSSSDVSEENIYDVSITRYITDEAIDNSATKICEAPCVLIVSRVGVGKVALSNMPLCTSQDFCNLVKIKCNPMFLAYQLSLIMKRKAKEVQGTSIKGITIDEIQKIEVFLPNKKEQNQIASKLSNVDNLISVETKFLQCYQKQRTYLLQQLFI